MLTTLNYSHWYGPGLMGAAVSTTEPEANLTLRANVGLAARATVDPTENLNLRKGNKMGVRSTPTPSQSLIVRSQVGLGLVSRVNELSQDDVTGAVLSAEIEPGLTFRQALIDARKAAKLAAALSA